MYTVVVTVCSIVLYRCCEASSTIVKVDVVLSLTLTIAMISQSERAHEELDEVKGCIVNAEVVTQSIAIYSQRFDI